MGLLTGLFERRASVGGSFHVSQTPPGWIDSLAGREVASGALVDESSALGVTTVFACIRVLAETEASLPLHLYERVGERGKRKAVDHPLYNLLWRAPNPEMTSFELREVVMHHLTAWGNAYCEIELDRRGRVVALWPLRPEPQYMRVDRVNGELRYTYRLPKPDKLGRPEVVLPAEQVLHFRGMGYDGIRGYSPIYLARQAVGLAMAAEEFGSRFFGNGATPGLVLEHPGKLSTEAHDRLRTSWERTHGGLEHSHRVAILEEGLKVEKIGIPPEDAQFLATRRFQVEEVCRIYRVPPHMVQDLERATFSNIENLSLGFVSYTMLPWLERLEQRLDVSLLLERERRSLYTKHEVAGLLRGDVAGRYAAYAQGRQNGWLSANDIRELEDMNPVEGGDVYLVPLNMVPADEVGGRTPSPAPSPAGEGDARGNGGRADGHHETHERHENGERRSAEASRHRLMGVWRRVYADTAGRIVRREVRDVRRAVERFAKQPSTAAAELSLWLESFYAEDGEFHGYTAKQLRPVSWSYGEEVAADVRAELGSRGLNHETHERHENGGRADGHHETHEIDERDSSRGLDAELEPWVQGYVERYARRHAGVSVEGLRKRVRRALEENLDLAAEIGELLDHWEAERADDIAQWESVRFNNALAHFMYGAAGVRSLRWMSFGKSCPYCADLDGKVVGYNQAFLDEGQAFQPEGAEGPLVSSTPVRHAPAHGGCDCLVVAG